MLTQLSLPLSFIKTFGLRRAIRKGLSTAMQSFMCSCHGEELIITENGDRMLLIPEDRGISRELRVFRIHEPLATRILMEELREGTITIDIGSNIGYYVILESRLVGSSGKVIAIEPVERTFQYLSKNVKINSLCNVRSIRVALSDEEGKVEMVRSDCSNKSLILDCRCQGTYDTEGVQATTGDKLLGSIENIGFIRMDVEGHEDHVINGCRRIIERWLPDILIEIHSPLLGNERLCSLLRRFADYGYAVKHAVPRIIDFPLVCDDTDISVMTINQFLEEPLSTSMMWSYYTLFLRHSSKS